MPKITILIGLPPRAGSPDDVVAVFTKTWLSTEQSPFRLIGIPHTGDNVLKLPVISEGKISWKISFVSVTTFDCDSNTACILANTSISISCPALGYENVPKGNCQPVVEKFISALLADEWTDEGNNFKHLKHA